MGKKSQGPIINGLKGELKPVDYKFIKELTQSAGLTKEYIKECERIHKKHRMKHSEQK